MSDATVYVVHAVDAEGPLREALEATFERLFHLFGIRLEPSRETLARLQRGEIDLGGREDAVARAFHPHLLEYHETWNEIDAMLSRVGSPSFRNALPDSGGRGWVYNWHCVDHVGYVENPRGRDIGFHNVFDHYRQFVRESQAPDGVHWHFHPGHHSRAAHQSSTAYLRDGKFFEVLARRIIDRGWFPSVNRAGFHSERPDSHWLLEQWIPFDLSNQSCDETDAQPDLIGGRFGDWRRAPRDWSIYHPAPDDYQIPGSCRRYVARCLNVGTRHRLLDEAEVCRAFERARSAGPTLLAFTDHDFRDIGRDVDTVRDLLVRVRPRFPDVRFVYSEAREAMNRVLFGEYRRPSSPLLSATLEPGPRPGSRLLRIRAAEPTFGPQPFLALLTRSGEYHFDNLDFQEPFRHWTYVFDELTYEWHALRTIGLGANDRRGFDHVLRIPCTA
jgi:hypothetical protein